MASIKRRGLPIGSHLTVKTIFADAKDKVKLSKHKFTVLLNRVVQECQYVVKTGHRHEWRLKSPLRLFQTRKLYISVFEGGMSSLPFGKETTVQRFVLSFSDLLKQRPDSPGTTTWKYRQSELIDANGVHIELSFDVTLDFFGLSETTYMGGAIKRQSAEDFEMRLDKISSVVEGFKEVKQRLADANVGFGEIADKLASVVKDIHPIAALVVTVVSIPFKMWKNAQKYSKQAGTLCEQIQRQVGYLQTMDTITSPSPSLLDALVLVIEGLISASDALTEFSNRGAMERAVQAQYDGTFDDLTQTLGDSEAQLAMCVTIDIRAEQARSQDTARLKAYLNPAELQPTGPLCHPKTRKDILEQIYAWVRQRDVREKTLRIDGLPGTGKTTLASTVYNWCCAEGLTPAKFFLVGKPGRPTQGAPGSASDLSAKGIPDAQKHDDPGFVWPTLAWQLAQAYPDIRKMLVDITRSGSPSTVIETQFERLIVPSINGAASSFKVSPLVIIIDALDEGMHKDLLRWSSLVRTIGLFSDKFPDVDYRLILLSRDNQVVRDYVTTGVRALHLFPGNQEELTSVLAEKLGPGSDCKNPLPQHDVEQLSICANGLFIWATTAIRHVRKGRDISHHRVSDLIAGPKDSDPIAAVRKLYDGVLKTAFRDLTPKEEQAVKMFLAIIMTLSIPRSLNEIIAYSEELKILSDRLMGDLLPILSVTEDQIYSFAHLSIAEYLADRKDHFAIPTTAAHTILAVRQLRGYRSLFVGAGQDILDYNTDPLVRRTVTLPRRWPNLQRAARQCRREWSLHLRLMVEHVNAVAVARKCADAGRGSDIAGVPPLRLAPANTFDTKKAFRSLLFWLGQLPEDLDAEINEDAETNQDTETDAQEMIDAGVITFVLPQDSEMGGETETDLDAKTETSEDTDLDEDTESDKDIESSEDAESDEDAETDDSEDDKTDQRAEAYQTADRAYQQPVAVSRAASHMLMHFTDDTIKWLDGLEFWLDPSEEPAFTRRKDRSFGEICEELAARGYAIEKQHEPIRVDLGQVIHSTPSWGSRCHI